MTKEKINLGDKVLIQEGGKGAEQATDLTGTVVIKPEKDTDWYVGIPFTRKAKYYVKDEKGLVWGLAASCKLELIHEKVAPDTTTLEELDSAATALFDQLRKLRSAGNVPSKKSKAIDKALLRIRELKLRRVEYITAVEFVDLESILIKEEKSKD